MLSRNSADEEKKKTKRRMGVMANTTYFSHPSFRFLLPIFLLSLPSLPSLPSLRALRGLFLLFCFRTGGKIVLVTSISARREISWEPRYFTAKLLISYPAIPSSHLTIHFYLLILRAASIFFSLWPGDCHTGVPN
jgi:hypothetical protein